MSTKIVDVTEQNRLNEARENNSRGRNGGLT